MSELTETELRQRQQAARKHGAYSVMTRGEEALDEKGRSYLQELRENVQTREGVLELMQENAARAYLVAQMVTSFVQEEARSGVPLEEINSVRSLPALYNTAQRALKDLLDHLPKEPRDIAELEKIQQVIDDDDA